jgi:hypothetical protein
VVIEVHKALKVHKVRLAVWREHKDHKVELVQQEQQELLVFLDFKAFSVLKEQQAV